VSDAVAIDPQHFNTRSRADPLPALVHNTVHAGQDHYGKPSRSGCHGQGWADPMERLGLTPLDAGERCGPLLGGGFRIN